jgi:PilZ domain
LDFFQVSVPAELEPVRKPRPIRRDMAAVMRKHPRYQCSGGVELRQQNAGTLIRASLSDISLTGCYVETASTLPIGSMVSFHLRTHDLELNGKAMVKAAHPSAGMGIAFLHLSQEDQQNLEFLIGALAGMREMLTQEDRTFVAADSQKGGPVTQSTSPAAAAAPLPETALISDQIMRAITELNELEQNLVKDKVDPRLIAQFHDAMAHTRQTAFTVQQWMDLRSSGEDPFQILPQLEAERMHMLTRLAHNVLADLDASGIGEFSEGVNDLYAIVKQLYKRLADIMGEI